MWDQGTREPEKPWTEEIAELMKEIGADGVNGDTQDGVPLAFSLAADKTGIRWPSNQKTALLTRRSLGM